MTKIKLILLTAIKTIIYFIFFFTLLVILGFTFTYDILDILTAGYYSEIFYPFIVLSFVLSFFYIFRKLRIFQKLWRWFNQKKYAKHSIIFLIVVALIIFSQEGLSRVPGACEKQTEAMYEDSLYRLNIPKGDPREGFALGSSSGIAGNYFDCIKNRQNVVSSLYVLFFGNGLILLYGILILYLIYKKQKSLNDDKIWIFRNFWHWLFNWFYQKKRYIIVNILIVCLFFIFSGWSINKIIKIQKLNCEKYIQMEEKYTKNRWTDWCEGAHKECIEQKQGLKNNYLSLFFGDVIILLVGISISRLVSKRQKSLNNKKNL